MNQSILRTSSALLVALLTCNTIARAEEDAAASLPAWAVNQKFASQLSDEFDGDWFTILPPKELEKVDIGDTTAYDRAGIKIAVWMKETGRSANPTITIMSLPAPPPDKQNSHEFFTGFLKSVTAKWPNAKGSKVSEGLWNDRPALRSRFSATAENGEAVRGAVLCASDDSATFAVCVLNSGDGDEETAELMTLENSAISCKQKLSRAP